MTVHDASKPALREHYRELRRALSHHQVEAASLSITAKLKTLLDWPQVRSVHIYQPLARDGEVDTRHFERWLQTATQSQIYHPDMNSDFPEVDVVLVPIIAFDERGHRLGFGGGTYDKWLANSKAVKIGLAYEFARTPGPLPAELHDQKLDMIVTDQQIHRF